MELCSEDVPARGAVTLGAWDVQWFCSPYGDAEHGGDRFITIEHEGDVWFLIADATGHGRPAERLWKNHGTMIRGAFRDTSEVAVEARIRRFAGQVNARLAGDRWTGDLPAHLCVTVGVLSAAGEVTWANLGFGTHALALTPAGLAWNEPERLFGLKLGWLDPDDWDRAPRAVVTNGTSGVERLILLTDGLLPGDHDDVDATLGKLRDLGEACRGVARNDMVDHVLNRCSYGDDDTTLLVIERAVGE